MAKVELEILIETSDHDGYCSGAECEYDSKIVKKVIPLPKRLEKSSIGEQVITNFDRELEQFSPKITTGGSGYCNLSKESIDHDLGYHDYRMTVLSAKVVDNISE